MAVGLDVSMVAALARWDGMDRLAADVAQTLEDERFPGAVVPALRRDGSPVFYALAQDAPSWRHLRPLLFAFAGPTLTDFEGVPAELDRTEPIERFLAEADLYAVVVLRPGTFDNAMKAALRALNSLLNATARAPDLTVSPGEPTSILLARLQDALNGKDLETAWRVFSTLENELRLDYQNLLQLEFQIYATSGDWARIRNDSRFESVCATRLAPASAEVLLETLYWSHFQEEEEYRVPFLEDDVVRLCRSLLDCVGQTPSPIVQKLMGLLSIERHGLEASDNTAVRVDSLSSGAVTRERLEDDSEALIHARSLFLALDDTRGENFHADAEAMAAYERLGEEDRDRLLSRPRFKAIWSEVQGRVGATPPPNDWIEWLKRLDDPEFDAIAYARGAADKWRLPDKPLDPRYFEDLLCAIEHVPAGIAGDRLDQSLPFFVDWVARDLQWPRTSLCPVYMALLTRIALTTRRGEKTIKSTTLLLESVLRCGLNASEYRDAMEAIDIIATEAFNRNTAYDILEFIEIAADFPVVDEVALHDATTAVATVARGLLNRLTAGQQMAYSHIAARIGWPTESDGLVSVGEGSMASTLSNMSVGIYTLTASAGRNARDILASLAPGIKIELNHDHEATAALGALVKRVDLFVVAWASAKHAATNFIKSRRGSDPLIYAAGKGASSLIRAIEEYSATIVGNVSSTRGDVHHWRVMSATRA